jgi:hypothetical protein
MIPLIAIPVIHSSGAFIASTATGYLAGTLSSTWLGAFVMGNAGLLAGASALTVSAIGGAFTGVKSSVTGVAASLGLISTTPAWVLPAAIVSGVTLVATGGYAYYKRNQIIDVLYLHMEEINTERNNAGLTAFDTPKDLLDEVLSYIASMRQSKGNFDSITDTTQYSDCTDLIPVLVAKDESWLNSMNSNIKEITQGISDKFTGENNNHDKVIHDLLYAMTNSEYIDSMGHVQLKKYIKSMGLVTQTIPSELRVNGELSILTLLKINQLDPSSLNGSWGNMCHNIAKTLGISLPEKENSELT